MYNRELASKLTELVKTFPVLTVTGPRQSGKTTLCRMTFPQYGYVNLEDPVLRSEIAADVKTYLMQYSDGLIIDEAHYLPEIFSYVQVLVDEDKKRRFVLSGSSNFLMMQNISQSLAGRAAVVRLLPLSVRELTDIERYSTDEIMLRGFFPAVWGNGSNPADVYRSYYLTYLQRDVVQLINVKDASAFQQFITLCAARVGNEFVAQDLSNETGISLPTVQSWFSVLEASYLAFRLQPYFRNIGKRLVKTPKLYFTDVGLACFLLGIRTPEHLKNHPLRGALFENMIVSEMLKNRYNTGEESNLFFYRDKSKREVDLVETFGMQIRAYEIKSAKRYNPEFFKNLDYLRNIMGGDILSTQVVYDGDDNRDIPNNGIVNYRQLLKNSGFSSNAVPITAMSAPAENNS
ncbi:MAG: ATP-binding protein [Bacteroidales bacterium]|nr:ATP-binding protein [Bacteroidales bacterium]